MTFEQEIVAELKAWNCSVLCVSDNKRISECVFEKYWKPTVLTLDSQRFNFNTLHASVIGRFDRILIDLPFANDIKLLQRAQTILQPNKGRRVLALCSPEKMKTMQLFASTVRHYHDRPCAIFINGGVELL